MNNTKAALTLIVLAKAGFVLLGINNYHKPEDFDLNKKYEIPSEAVVCSGVDKDYLSRNYSLKLMQ